MTAIQRVRSQGFQRWYQSELTQSHLHLVLLLLCAVALFSTAEVFSAQLPLGQRVVLAGCALTSGVIGVWALRRYLYLLMHAEYVANQAACPACKSYAQWNLLADSEGGRRWRVQCRRCGHLWEIDS
ncbi:MAG: hypothetical protein AB1430_08325 [Pseudomonadota bacterium]